MDCSVEYIEMCRRTVEVQELWKPAKYDIVYDVKGRKNIHVVTSYPDKYFPTFSIDRFQENRKKEEFIWLPRQDQLQDMVDSKQSIFFFDNKAFTLKEKFEGRSYEQLWLQIVMHELHGKKWDGEDWVKPQQPTAEPLTHGKG